MCSADRSAKSFFFFLGWGKGAVIKIWMCSVPIQQRPFYIYANGSKQLFSYKLHGRSIKNIQSEPPKIPFINGN